MDEQETKGRYTTATVWFTPDQAAAYLGVERETIMRRARDGQIRYSKVTPRPNGKVRFRREWLDEYLERRATGGEN